MYYLLTSPDTPPAPLWGVRFWGGDVGTFLKHVTFECFVNMLFHSANIQSSIATGIFSSCTGNAPPKVQHIYIYIYIYMGATLSPPLKKWPAVFCFPDEEVTVLHLYVFVSVPGLDFD